MTEDDQLIVATANTYFDKMVLADRGFEAVSEADVLLLQEVIDPDGDRLETQLSRAGFELIHAAGKYGLAIARRSGIGLQYVPGSNHDALLGKMKPIERHLAQKWATRPHQFVARGFISSQFRHDGQEPITMVTTHPTVPFNPIERTWQIRKLTRLLGDPMFDGAMILGADMNHWPRAHGVDRRLYEQLSLQPVDIGDQLTWVVSQEDTKLCTRSLSTLPARLLGMDRGQQDSILYRGEGISPVLTRLIDIPSDHKAIMTQFALNHFQPQISVAAERATTAPAGLMQAPVFENQPD